MASKAALRGLMARPLVRSSSRTMTSPGEVYRLLPSRRTNSTQPSAYSSFFKSFGRPIFKVCLMAILTYQFAYFGWVKLEHNEIRAERQSEVDALEEHVKELKEKKKA